MAVKAGYPTREEILAEEPTYTPQIIERMKAFKKFWRRAEGNNELREQHLRELLFDLNVLFAGEPLTIVRGDAYCYQPAAKKLMISDPLSIISGLHELGHHLMGSSEKDACRFSVHLFKQTFPVAYSKLRWDGHMLKKQ